MVVKIDTTSDLGKVNMRINPVIMIALTTSASISISYVEVCFPLSFMPDWHEHISKQHNPIHFFYLYRGIRIYWAWTRVIKFFNIIPLTLYVKWKVILFLISHASDQTTDSEGKPAAYDSSCTFFTTWWICTVFLVIFLKSWKHAHMHSIDKGMRIKRTTGKHHKPTITSELINIVFPPF